MDGANAAPGNGKETTMNRQPVTINGVKLEIRDRGSGEPIMFVHGAMGDELAAVLEQPALTERFRLIDYHRRGFGGSAPVPESFGIAQQSADCLAVMRHLGIERAHFSGQSYGGVIILQVALDAPEVVHSLALLEPALPAIMFSSDEFLALSGKVGEMYQAGDKAGAVNQFGLGICGADYFAVFARHLPTGWFERWVTDLDTVMLNDMPILGAWTFGAAEAARITQPALNLRGAGTASYMRAVHEALRGWLAQAESDVLPNASHAMTQTNPKGAAERLARFFAGHPL
jgi:pimeloyl-ACP methyl ester carboxylesterase